MPVLREGHMAQGRPTDTLPSLQLGAQKQSQGMQYSPARLQEQLGATQAQEQQSLQQLSRTNEAIQGLHRQVAELQQQVRARHDSTGMQPQSHTPLLPPGEAQPWPITLSAPQLCWQVQDMENLQEELAQARQESTKQAEKIAAYKTHRQQLHQELRRMQTFWEQSKREVRMSQVFL